MGSCLSKTEEEKEIRRKKKQIKARRLSLELQQTVWKNSEFIRAHHREQNRSEFAKYKEQTEKFDNERASKKPIQRLHRQQVHRGMSHREKSLQQGNVSLPQSSILPPASAPTGQKNKRKARKKKVSPKLTSQSSLETFRSRLIASNVYFNEWTEVDYIVEMHKIHRHVAENILKLFDDDDTIPFIARYRKHLIPGMYIDDLRNIKSSRDEVKEIKQKANDIINMVEKEGKWTVDFHIYVHSTKSINDLKQIYAAFNSKKSSLVQKSKDIGLASPANAIITAESLEPLHFFVKPQVDGLKTEDQVRVGIISILVDEIKKDKSTFEKLKILRSNHPLRIETSKANNDKNEQTDVEDEYSFYYDFSCFENQLKPEQVFMIYRGQASKIINVKVNIPADFEKGFKDYCAERYQYACGASQTHKTLLTAAFNSLWKDWIKSSLVKKVRQELMERAEDACLQDMATSLKQRLLQPPVRSKTIVGIKPDFHLGCKLAVVSERGDVLETETIYPHRDDNSAAKYEAERSLTRIVLKYSCTILAIGNGKACRATKVFLTELIKKRAFEPINVVYTIVDEMEALAYGCSQRASLEFPKLDPFTISAVFMARRLQDPMAELVKIELKNLSFAMFKHNIPEKRLASKLNEVIREAVSYVGVDVNTASVSLLKHVAGLDKTKAENIIEWRKASGPFRTRSDLIKVRGICTKIFQQCAGFVRIVPETALALDRKLTRDSLNNLDQTWIHPETYGIAEALIKAAAGDSHQFGTEAFRFAVAVFADQRWNELAERFNTNVETVKMIAESLTRQTEHDIRGNADTSMFLRSLKSFENFTIGTVLTGVVCSNTNYGAFVDVDVERAGLIHKSQMRGTTLFVGQRVEARVQNVDRERSRFGLTLIRCF